MLGLFAIYCSVVVTKMFSSWV